VFHSRMAFEDQAEGAELVFLAFPVAPGGVRDRAISVTVLLPEGRHQAGDRHASSPEVVPVFVELETVGIVQ